MLSMAQHVVSKLEQQKDHDNNDDDDHVSYRHLNDRERCHIRALRYMLQYQHKAALYTYLDLLRKCPGDVLALSLLLDLANTLGDSQTALKAAASTAPYWNERRGGWIRPAIPGYAIGTYVVRTYVFDPFVCRDTDTDFQWGETKSDFDCLPKQTRTIT